MPQPSSRPTSLRPWLFRRLVRPAYHRTWAEAERTLMGDPMQRRRIEEMEREIDRSGIERPVVLGRDHWWSVRPRVCDGVHRSVASMRTGHPVPLRFGYDEHLEYDLSDRYQVTAIGEVPGPEDLMDAVMDAASWRSAAGPWVQCDFASGVVDGPVEILLTRHPELRGLIADELRERLRGMGVDARVEFMERQRRDHS